MTANVNQANRHAHRFAFAISSVLLLASFTYGQIHEHNVNHDAADSCEYAKSCSTSCPCRAVDCRGDACSIIRDMWEREPAAGNEPQHYSYDTRRLYYYRRPYNMAHVREARLNMYGENESESPFHARSDYSTRAKLFRQVNRELADQVGGNAESKSIEGGHLEYVDWQQHQQAKEAWEQDRLSELDDDEPQLDSEATSILQSKLRPRATHPIR